MLNEIGLFLAVVSTALGLVGTVVNSAHNHKLALYIWSPANIMAFVWAVGVVYQWWQADLGAIAMAVMYGAYIIVNTWGVIPYAKKDLNI